MTQSHDGVMVDHSRSGITHDASGFFLHVLFIAMDRAVAAGWLLLLIRTQGESVAGVLEKLLTACTKGVAPTFMLVMTVDLHHGSNGPFLPVHAGGPLYSLHVLHITCKYPEA